MKQPCSLSASATLLALAGLALMGGDPYGATR
jgi:hypothetical protein